MSKGALAGWGVAGLLLIALVGQCGKQPSTDAKSLAASSSRAPAASTMFVQPSAAKCRSRPSIGGEIVTRFSKATSVSVSREESGWSLIDRSPSCWIRSDLLRIMPPLADPEPIRPAYSARSSGGGSSGRNYTSAPRRSQRYDAGSCPCRGSHVCIGPRGGRYCITSGGNKRYGV